MLRFLSAAWSGSPLRIYDAICGVSFLGFRRSSHFGIADDVQPTTMQSRVISSVMTLGSTSAIRRSKETGMLF